MGLWNREVLGGRMIAKRSSARAECRHILSPLGIMAKTSKGEGKGKGKNSLLDRRRRRRRRLSSCLGLLDRRRRRRRRHSLNKLFQKRLLSHGEIPKYKNILQQYHDVMVWWHKVKWVCNGKPWQNRICSFFTSDHIPSFLMKQALHLIFFSAQKLEGTEKTPF